MALLARVDADTRGQELRQRLRAERVHTGYVIEDAAAPTGVALIMVGADGEKQILTAPGANRRVSAEDVAAAAGAIRSTRVLLSQLEAPPEAVLATVEIAHAAGAQVVLDPAPATPLPDELLQRLTVIRPNAHEAEVLTGIPVRDRTSAREAARALLARGAGAAVVQAGSAGDLLVWPEGEHFLPRLPVVSVDATGAGDAFAATIAVSLAQGSPLSRAAEFGSAAAALATTQPGAWAGLGRWREIHTLLRDRQENGGSADEV